MLRVLFFVTAYLTDYRALPELLRGGSTLGLVNAALVGFVCGWMLIRAWRAERSRRTARGQSAR
jgi:hypothetical protein